MNTSNPKSPGFTVVELVVALTVGLISVAIVYAVFTQQNQSALQTESKLDVNSSTINSFNLVSNDLRMAGYRVPPTAAVSPLNNFVLTPAAGTSSATGPNDLDGSGVGSGPLKTGLINDVELGLRTATDAALVIHTDNEDCNTLANLGVEDANPFYNNATAGAYAFICEPNCFSTAVYPNPATAPVVGLVTSAGRLGQPTVTMGIFVKITGMLTGQVAAGFCTAGRTRLTYSNLDELNFWFKPAGVVFDSGGGFAAGSQFFYRLESAFLYYVTKSTTNPAFARLPLDTAFNPQVIAYGVEDLQIQYNKTPTCTNWCTGSCVNCNAPGDFAWPPSNNLEQIRSMTVGMVVRHQKADESSYYDKGLPLALFDHTPTMTPDSYRRRIMSQLIRVRNLEMQDFTD